MRAFHSTTRLPRRRHRRPPCFLPSRPFPVGFLSFNRLFSIAQNTTFFLPSNFVCPRFGRKFPIFAKISRYYNRKSHISPNSFLLTAIFFHCPEHHDFFPPNFGCPTFIWAAFSKILAKSVDFTIEKTHISPDSILFNRPFFFHCPEHHLFFSPILYVRNLGDIFQNFG